MYRMPLFNLKTAWKKVQQKSYKGHKVIDRDVKYLEKKFLQKCYLQQKMLFFSANFESHSIYVKSANTTFEY
jgi:hypothetical protein